MGAHIAALVVEEFVVDGENGALGIDRGADLVTLLARVIGCDQVLAPVLDPFHRPSEPQRGEADQHVLGVELAADAEAAADMAFEQVHSRGAATEHARDAGAIPVRHLGGAIKLEHIAGGVVARDGAARLQRHAGMPSDGKIEFNDDSGVAKRRRDIAIGLFHHRRLGRTAVLEFPRRRAGVEDHRQFFDRDCDEIGRVLRHVGVDRKHRRDRLADIAHALPGQNRLAIGRQALDAGQAEIDRRNLGDVGRRPHGDDARHRQRRTGVDRHDAAVGMAGAHHAHVQHAGKGDIGGEGAAARHQRPVLETGHRTSDEAHVRPCSAAIVLARHARA